MPICKGFIEAHGGVSGLRIGLLERAVRYITCGFLGIEVKRLEGTGCYEGSSSSAHYGRSLMARDQVIRRGGKPLRIAHHGDRNIRVGNSRRPARVIDNVQDATFPMSSIEEDREQIVETSRRQGGGDLKRVFGVDGHALVEEAVAAHPVSAEAGHSAGNLEGRPAVDTGSLHPRRMAGWVIGHLVLEEDVRAAIPVPDDLVL